LKIDAIVTAGGRGTRISELGKEKPMVEVRGIPLIKRVLSALEKAEGVQTIFVSVSKNTPITSEFVENLGYEIIPTSGEDYVSDLRDSMRAPKSSAVLVCPADVPLITSESVDEVIAEYREVGKPSLALVIPVDCIHSLGLDPTFEMEVNGRKVVLCGVSIVDREMMISEEYLEEGYHISGSFDFAINVNSTRELHLAERVLERRIQSSSPSNRA